MILRHIPNLLTISRLVLILPFLTCLFQGAYLQAFFIFFIAGLTDGIDGWMARYFSWQSPFGSFVDPLADKLLISLSYISLGLMGKLPLWLVILVLLRDVTIVLGILAWFQYVRRPLEFNPTFLSKTNTVLQLGLVFFSLFQLAYFALPPVFLNLAIFITAITTTSSYIDYAWKGAIRAYSNTPQPS